VPKVDPVPLYMTDEDGRVAIEMHVVPLQPHLAADVMRPQPMAMVLLRCPFYRSTWPRSAHRPYDLTHAEMATLAAMIEGLTPGEHAERSGVRISTVRSQIKAILAKTGSRRIAEVVALFAAVDMPRADRSAS
jgi:DNA-binding CsgD family transcriptional regulator